MHSVVETTGETASARKGLWSSESCPLTSTCMTWHIHMSTHMHAHSQSLCVCIWTFSLLQIHTINKVLKQNIIKYYFQIFPTLLKHNLIKDTLLNIYFGLESLGVVKNLESLVSDLDISEWPKKKPQKTKPSMHSDVHRKLFFCLGKTSKFC